MFNASLALNSKFVELIPEEEILWENIVLLAQLISPRFTHQEYVAVVADPVEEILLVQYAESAELNRRLREIW